MDTGSSGGFALLRGGVVQRTAGGCAIQHAEAKLLATNLTGEEAPERASIGSGCRDPRVKLTCREEPGGVAIEGNCDSAPKRTNSRSAAPRSCTPESTEEKGMRSGIESRVGGPTEHRPSTGTSRPKGCGDPVRDGAAQRPSRPKEASSDSGSSPMQRCGPGEEVGIRSSTGDRSHAA